jgi:hypothetical protein
VHGDVEGDVVAIGGGIRLHAGAKIGDSAVAVGGPVAKAAGATIRDEIDERWWMPMPGQCELFWRGSLILVGWNLLLAALGWTVLRPRRIARMAEVFHRRWLLALGLGFLTLLIAVGLYGAILQFPQWINWGWAILSILLTLLAAPGFAAISTELTGKLFATRRTDASAGVISATSASGSAPFPANLPAVLAGGALLALAMLIPLVGLLAFAALCILSWGTVLSSRFGIATE